MTQISKRSIGPIVKAPKQQLVVELKSVGNPDFGQDPSRPLYGAEPNRTVIVEDLGQAREECLNFIDENDLGSGNWAGGRVYKDKKLVARISYNGRVWEPGDSPFLGKEITDLKKIF